jgi:pimeloyl-ACP methyl ester carboxylesterase
MAIEVREIDANGMTFTCRTAGLEGGGEPVLLLHGYPATSAIWLRLLGELAEAGYRCLAPDQRGYSPGARPEGMEHYRYGALASDVVALADAAGFDRFHLIGHDWGSAVGWAVLALSPERVQSWTALSVPHVAAFGEAIANDPDQRQRSGYIDLFVKEGEAEATFSENDFERPRRGWAADTPEQQEAYLDVLRQPGVITAAQLVPCRALLRPGSGPGGDVRRRLESDADDLGQERSSRGTGRRA